LRHRILFVTGKLAEPALRETLAALAPQAGFESQIEVLGISVAALMTPDWVARQLSVPAGVDRVVLPGWCGGDLENVRRKAKVPVELGPKDLRDLPEHFGTQRAAPAGYGAYDIAIIAEINHCPRLPFDEILALARQYRDDGADIIDVGCEPGTTWSGVADVVRRLRAEGFRVSIDSFDSQEVEHAVAAGAELVLSANGSNLDAALNWGAEVVAVPDDIATLGGLDRTIDRLDAAGVRYRIDPVIEPIGYGFAASLARYMEVRRRWPRAEIMMGIGNLTELTEVDSAGINALLIGICQELGIRSVLTTQVINWARSSVRELDVARRLMFHSVTNRVLPKHLDPRLVMLRDAKVHEHGPATLSELSRRITDPNFRIFAERGEIHIMNSQGYWHGRDPFLVFQEMLREDFKSEISNLDSQISHVESPTPQETPEPTRLEPAIDAAHAFYLGYEMAKAVTALTLGKDYRQDEALDWGLLTRPEVSHRLRTRQSG
jgi:dihydropteroate synthase-like protein